MSGQISLLVRVLKQLSLEDRDSGKWKLDPEETQKRRELFYEILTYDSWQVWFTYSSDFPARALTQFLQSLTFGRPPSLAAVHIDCKLPHETSTTPTGEVEMSCRCRWVIVEHFDADPFCQYSRGLEA